MFPLRACDTGWFFWGGGRCCRQAGSYPSVGEKSPLHSSYERGCQEKRLLPAPRRDAGVVTYIQPSHSRKGDWFGRFGSPQIAGVMPTPVACPHSIVS